MKKKKIFLFLTILFFTITLIISTFNIIKWLSDNKKISDQTKDIKKITDVVETKDSNNTEIIKQEQIDKDNPYWDYIKMNLINVDFNKLKKINPSTKGWIKVNGTNINYPFVQDNNNEYYLTHSFDKSYNSAGWVFLDYRNDLSNLSDKNTIIYAHGRYDKTMFGSLKNILTSGWLENSDNYIIKMSTEYENTLWQIFSVYKIPTTSDYIQVNFSSDDEFYELLNKLISRSNYDFNTTVSKDDRIITLSTCYDKDNKVVLHAKLIKREKK